MRIKDIYQQYQIMPNLQEHMLTVGSVAATVCDHFYDKQVDKTSIVAACLLHDMGNIIKFDLTSFPDFLQPKGLNYWQGIKESFHERYGDDENVAVELIAEELGIPDRVKELIQGINLLKAKENCLGKDFEKKICEYADNRVSPMGVVSIEERLMDLEKRYGDRHPMQKDQDFRQQLFRYGYEMEAQIFAKCDISPDQITKAVVSDTIDSLKSFVIFLKA